MFSHVLNIFNLFQKLVCILNISPIYIFHNNFYRYSFSLIQTIDTPTPMLKQERERWKGFRKTMYNILVKLINILNLNNLIKLDGQMYRMSRTYLTLVLVSLIKFASEQMWEISRKFLKLYYICVCILTLHFQKNKFHKSTIHTNAHTI